MIRNVEKYRDAAQIEIEILEKIRKAGGCEVSYLMTSSPYDGVTCELLVQDLLTKRLTGFRGEIRDDMFVKFATRPAMDSAWKFPECCLKLAKIDICRSKDNCELFLRSQGEFLQLCKMKK